ncbi:hypothetical protein PGT21_004826 [Puccinia graminis f. sp. tritici]|uniref:Uncharacterized protein n=2 Tax=Puccinia graminis f. sp. tritici TaxID=56615 RepID=E3JV65_PUCGT|nr:uncharacterized protein PGTG_01271 [Puccinia graminis f. sp. tritici CRL 75-36-700-3]EFP75940.1 hypothetical protein PGTG_01271 [Puccinia graminis f. sp. tritici CRL 75-36-700-3]KAA1077364.1 hypothetical protein PGT21_004826 [Puccinia graminis f. sp. tritici]
MDDPALQCAVREHLLTASDAVGWLMIANPCCRVKQQAGRPSQAGKPTQDEFWAINRGKHPSHLLQITAIPLPTRQQSLRYHSFSTPLSFTNSKFISMRSVIVAACLLAAAAMASPVELQARKPCGNSCDPSYINGGNIGGGFFYDNDRSSDSRYHDSASQFQSTPFGTFSSQRENDAAASSRDHTQIISIPGIDDGRLY